MDNKKGSVSSEWDPDAGFSEEDIGDEKGYQFLI
jgi:hypothetical protein